MSHAYTMRTLSGRPQRTRIICTLGPSSSDIRTLGAMIDAGMNVARINMSHGSHERAAELIRTLRQAADERGRIVGILLDLCGPKIRVRDIEGGGVELSAGGRIDFVRGDACGTGRALTTTYDAFVDDVRPGDPVYLDDGSIRLQVTDKTDAGVSCRVEVGGRLLPRKGINLPGTTVSAPALTEKDIADLAFGVEQGVDFTALSFVRSAAEVLDLKQRLKALGSEAKVVAKIEKPQAIERLEEIIEASDAVMVARGDLGIELPVERVPILQKRIVRACRHALKPVIVATQMLESMIEHATPTRAEVSDIANAIEDGCDAVMLSAETASGRHPLEAVSAMGRVARDVEGALADRVVSERFITEGAGDPLRKAMVMGAAMIAGPLQAKFIVTRSETGETARYLSAVRGSCPVIAAHPDPAVLRRHTLYCGVLPVQTAGGQGHAPASMEEELRYLARSILERGLVVPEDQILVISGFPWGEKRAPNNIRAVRISETV